MGADKGKEDLDLIHWIRPSLASSDSTLISRGLDLANALRKNQTLEKNTGDLGVHSEVPDPFAQFENSLGMRFICMPPGSFMMGSPPDEPERHDHEQHHLVKLTKGFYLQASPVTVGQWRSFAAESGFRTEAEKGGGAFIWIQGRWRRKAGAYWEKPGFPQSENHPVTCISWYDAKAFIEWLSQREKRNYRLPTEAEWEYSCRAGSTTRFHFGDDVGRLKTYAWYWENSERRTHPVAGKEPNAWGLHDMHGNVWELCEDRCAWRKKDGRITILTDNYRDGVIDPICMNGAFRISRGGDWFSPARSCRSARRLICSPKKGNNVRGFRLISHP